MSDAEMPSVFSNNRIKARKKHICYECKHQINVGDFYWLAKGCWDGKWSDFHVCELCDELRHELRTVENDVEYAPFGCLSEWAEESGIEFPVTEGRP